MRPIDNAALEAEIELTAQELLAPLAFDTVVELDDIALEIACENADAANAHATPQEEDPLQTTSEIELTPEQMDAMLEGRWP
jgi:hypothetical protein